MLPPYQGFRFIFSLVNGLIWFGIAYGVSSAISPRIEAAGRFHTESALIFGAVISFFACFFGLPDAYGGFLKQAHAGRFKKPKTEPSPNATGRLSRIIFLAGLRGLVSAFAGVLLIRFYIARWGMPERSTLCINLGIWAGFVSLVNNWSLTSPASLLDLKPPKNAPQAADLRYLLYRFGLPQGFGNGLITALVGWGSYPAEGSMNAQAVGIDALITALIIVLFMIFMAGTLAPVDTLLGRIEKPAGPALGWGKRLAWIAFSVVASGVLGYGLTLLMGRGGMDREIFSAWKFGITFVLACGFAMETGRRKLHE